MQLALSTRWNAGRHTDGEAMLGEILELGFSRVELGYDLRIDLVPGVQSAIQSGDVRVVSLHNFCPVPIGAPQGHPELYLLGSSDPRIRERAVQHTLRTVEFAAQTGARCVVVHAGYVDVRHHTRDLMRLCEAGDQYGKRFEKTKVKLLMQRDKKAATFVDYLCESLEALLPNLEKSGVCLAMENLPSWEAMPSEPEVATICERLDSDSVRYWHDIGHGRIRQNLGFIGHRRWLEKLSPWIAGYHVHDVRPPLMDHVMPPHGCLDFEALAPLIKQDVPLVLEPSPDTPPEALVEGAAIISEAWHLEKLGQK